MALVGWLNRHQQAVIDYLIEESRVLNEQLEGHLPVAHQLLQRHTRPLPGPGAGKTATRYGKAHPDVALAEQANKRTAAMNRP
jgi:hypothetical protein